MSKGDDAHPTWRKYYFHAVRKLALCEIAERNMLSGYPIKVYAKISNPGDNIIVGVERAYTNAMYWGNLPPYE